MNRKPWTLLSYSIKLQWKQHIRCPQINKPNKHPPLAPVSSMENLKSVRTLLTDVKFIICKKIWMYESMQPGIIWFKPQRYYDNTVSTKSSSSILNFLLTLVWHAQTTIASLPVKETNQSKKAPRGASGRKSSAELYLQLNRRARERGGRRKTTTRRRGVGRGGIAARGIRSSARGSMVPMTYPAWLRPIAREWWRDWKKKTM